MADLKKLIAGHAYWSDKKRELKDKGAHEAGLCEGLDTCEDNHNQIVGIGRTCIDAVVEQVRESNSESQYNDYSFEEMWEVMDGEGEVCQHCKNVRALKADRMKASRRLGAIRAAITRVGRTLEYKENNG